MSCEIDDLVGNPYFAKAACDTSIVRTPIKGFVWPHEGCIPAPLPYG